jgi:lysophospholipase L1-like esterase
VRRRLGWGLVAAVLAVGAAVAVAKIGPSGGREEVAAAPSTPPRVYVAVGGCETFGAGADDPFRTSYARTLFGDLALPATFVNFAVPGALVAGVLGVVPVRAADLDADVVTVWLGSADLVAGTPVEAFEHDLTDLLDRMAAPGRVVLVANLPAFDEVPVALTELAGTGDWDACETDRLVLPTEDQVAAVDEWNEAIARAARSVGATVVDVHGVVESARRAGSPDPLGGDGFFPSQAGHDAVAEAFARALADADAVAAAAPEAGGG